MVVVECDRRYSKSSTSQKICALVEARYHGRHSREERFLLDIISLGIFCDFFADSQSIVA
ncbi:hypothetical protein [Nostoc sp. 'Peltigera membranacea cyanobiont' 232]|uniref:hypothetical protein n=1 Tax=Nostoc sp. 'Peltigera membranacea cyanobiont' 232 TaxID=2014531 RepID=UPI00117D47BA|nr:hypothetical protein [Nostoc sp. 'Peltigera membranacea cyanobiont' 232]